MVACGATPPAPGAGAPQGLVVHEWGTFTSVQASDGRDLEGLLHEDEPPPPFVHRRALALPGAGRTAAEILAANVTQRMETPVVYFHSDRPLDVEVDIDFPHGLVTEWYPNATAFLPALAPAPAPPLAPLGGRMSWRVSLVPGLTDLPPARDYVWVPAREVVATPLRHSNDPTERDRFIFYRGVGRFSTPFSVRSQNVTALELRNASLDRIPAAFLLYVVGDRGRVVELGAIDPGARTVAVPPKETPIDVYVSEASEKVFAALRATGLYDDEARAMVNTWQRSYFRTQGLRVLYVLPRAWTDALLPIRISPAPSELVRTLVGRVEVFSREEELALAVRIESAATSRATMDIRPLGAFAEPKLRRARELVSNDAARVLCDRLIEEASREP
jgi:hypothetical protein